MMKTICLTLVLELAFALSGGVCRMMKAATTPTGHFDAYVTSATQSDLAPQAREQVEAAVTKIRTAQSALASLPLTAEGWSTAIQANSHVGIQLTADLLDGAKLVGPGLLEAFLADATQNDFVRQAALVAVAKYPYRGIVDLPALCRIFALVSRSEYHLPPLTISRGWVLKGGVLYRLTDAVEAILGLPNSRLERGARDTLTADPGAWLRDTLLKAKSLPANAANAGVIDQVLDSDI